MNFNSKLVTLLTLVSVMTYVKTVDQTNVIALKDFFDTLNDFRTKPAEYATKLQARILDNLDENNKLPETGYTFKEGRAVVQEAIDFLNTVQAVPALTLDQGMVRSAWEHSNWQISQDKPKISRKGPAGEDPAREFDFERFLIHNNYETDDTNNKVRELILNADENKWDCSQLLIFRLIIDDKRTQRKKRQIIFDPSLTVAGVGIAPYSKPRKNGKPGKKRDRITVMFATNAICNDCDTFTQTVNDQICWTNFIEGDNTCDPENVRDAARRRLLITN